jgi:hypothetical protein
MKKHLLYKSLSFVFGISVLAMLLIVPADAGATRNGKNILTSNNQQEAKFDFRLYPNPSDGREINLNIEGLKSPRVELSIYSVLGNLVEKKLVETQGVPNLQIKIVPQQELVRGIYFFSVVSGSERITKRLIVNV